MATVQMSRYAAEAGWVPPVCICCGASAQVQVRHTFYYQPTWLVLIYVFLPRILKWYFSSKPAQVPVPLCAAHRRRLYWPTYLGCLLVAGALVLVPAMVISLYSEMPTLMNALAALMVIWVLGLWLAYILVAIATPRAQAYTASQITLTAVSPAYAQAVAARGVGVQQGLRPLPGLGGVQPASGIRFGATSRVALGVCGLGVMLLCARLYVMLSRSSSPSRNFAQASSDFHPPPLASPSFRPPAPPSYSDVSNSFAASSSSSATLTPTYVPPPPPPPPTTPAETPSSSSPSAADARATTDPLTTATTPDTAATPDSATTQAAAPSPPPSFPTSPIARDFQPPRMREFDEPGPPETPWDPEGARIAAKLGPGLEPTVFPNNSIPVGPGTPLAVGDRVWVLQGITWVAGTVREVFEPFHVRVHTPPSPERFAHLFPRSYLRLVQEKPAAAGNSASARTTESAAKSTDPEVRTWTDSSGKFQIEARLVAYKNGKVTLLRTDGKLITLPFEKLSATDQRFVETKAP